MPIAELLTSHLNWIAGLTVVAAIVWRLAPDVLGDLFQRMVPEALRDQRTAGGVGMVIGRRWLCNRGLATCDGPEAGART